jgi:hypothetical protein
MPLRLPVQAIVDRREVLAEFTVDTNIVDPKPPHALLKILRDPVFGPYGNMPADPGSFSRQFNAATAVCAVLSAPAAARCMRAGGYR